MTNQLKNNCYRLRCIILLFIASALSACNEQTIYHTFQSLPTEGWQKKDTLFFNVEVPDSQTHYKLSIEVRNKSNYAYQNLNLSITYSNPDSLSMPTDSLHLTLANQEGIWEGEGFGGLYQSSFFARNIQINKAGIYLFKIAHTLADDTLYGINDIGIKLKR